MGPLDVKPAAVAGEAPGLAAAEGTFAAAPPRQLAASAATTGLATAAAAGRQPAAPVAREDRASAPATESFAKGRTSAAGERGAVAAKPLAAAADVSESKVAEAREEPFAPPLAAGWRPLGPLASEAAAAALSAWRRRQPATGAV